MKSEEIRKKFLTFFEERRHAVVPSSSLIPDDPSVLLTTAGMQQFKKYYTGEADPIKDFGARNTVSVQKSFRTSDIDEVGDDSHLTFFEMLGNFSFGGYFKKEAIQYAYEFITKEMGLEISHVTIFQGSDVVPKDKESEEIWKSLGVNDVREEGMEDVFWGPTGASGPCGPTTEIYCKNADGQDVEIWNIVFNEFLCSSSREQLLAGNATLTSLEKKGIDTGMGLERLAMISQGKKNIFETDLFAPIVQKIGSSPDFYKRIIADHARGIVFLIGDGVRPSNKDQGYILRRLMRRAMAHLREHANFFEKTNTTHSVSSHIFFTDIINVVIDLYGVVDTYQHLITKKDHVLMLVGQEEERFERVYKNGKMILEKLIGQAIENKISELSGKDIFDLVTSQGFVFDWIKDVAKEYSVTLDITGFEVEFKKHQELSRAGQEKKFGGHGLLLDTGELKAANEEELKIVTRLHTATHLLQAALHKVLGFEVTQQGSDITAERTRFDFSFGRKLTPEEIKQVEDMINQAIERDYTVEFKEMSYEDAIKSGALHFFREKYPVTVKVYSVFDSKTGEVFSREFCGGPHVAHTGEIGQVKILKEEASSAGIRRIRVGVR